ncbi:hypothetical protein DL98DRAFT_630977, partial [Cadophora sp. DSE1049]
LERIIWVLCSIISIFRAEPTISISRLATRLVRDSVFHLGDGESDLPVRQCIISFIGWCSLLFIPSRTITDNVFDLDTQGANCFTRTSIALESAQRPIDELLRSFGELLPKKPTEGTYATETKCSLKLRVSNLNIATLKKLAGMTIIWVDAVGAHLDFDPTTASLCLFKAPSYCKLKSSKNTFLLARITKDFYTDGECRTETFSPQVLMNEIILSYGLLFQNWRLAREVYRDEERSRASTTINGEGKVDPWLDKLCGMDLPIGVLSSMSSKHGIRDTYDAKSQFPILSGRLKAIQDYMDGKQPSRIASLWNDRRDLRLWYTVWVVLILGIISIIQSFLGIFLSGAQVAIASRAFELQMKQSQSTLPFT